MTKRLRCHGNKVYFIRDQATGIVKIGKSKNPQERLKKMQTGTPNELKLIGSISGGMMLERSLHVFFGQYNVRGEWFSVKGILKSFLYGRRKIYLSTIADFLAHSKEYKLAKYIESITYRQPFLQVNCLRRATVSRSIPAGCSKVRQIPISEYDGPVIRVRKKANNRPQ